MKIIKKIVCLALAVLLCLAIPCSTLAAKPATQKKEKKVTIFVDGINTVDIYSKKTNEQIFPPTGDLIMKNIGPVVFPLLKGLFTKNFNDLKKPLNDFVYNVFGELACDENGKIVGTYHEDASNTDKEIKAKAAQGDSSLFIKFRYDWRKDMKTLSKELCQYIKHVIKITGVDSVALVGFSLGSAVTLTYLKQYDYKYVNSVVLVSPAANGTSTADLTLGQKIHVTNENCVRFTESLLSDDELDDVAIGALIRKMGIDGSLSKICEIGGELIEQCAPTLYNDSFTKTLLMIPGFWNLVSFDKYEGIKDLYKGKIPEKFFKVTDWYHYEIQKNNSKILQGCLDRGIKMGIVAKYGSPLIFLYDTTTDSDGMVDTEKASFGATCSSLTDKFSKKYTQKINYKHNCISPDRMIDSSTCKFTSYTWFIKNCYHDSFGNDLPKLCAYIIDSKKQPNVWNSKFPQYLISTGDTDLSPLTKKNNYSTYGDLSTYSNKTILNDFSTGIVDNAKSTINSKVDEIKSKF